MTRAQWAARALILGAFALPGAGCGAGGGGDLASSPDAVADAAADDATDPGPDAPAGVRFVRVATATHVLAQVEGGDVRCWGANESGQCGVAVPSVVPRDAPVRVDAFRGALALAAGAGVSCAVLADRTVACAGGNDTGVLGRASDAASTVPVAIPGLSGVTSLAASPSGTFACAVDPAGAVFCWGANDLGQTGRPASKDPVTAPSRVADLGVAKKVALGNDFACAVLADGTVWCWGADGNGECGVDPGSAGACATESATACRTTPSRIDGVVAASDLAAGGASACVVAGGAVACWGTNATGSAFALGTPADGAMHLVALLQPSPLDAGVLSLNAHVTASGRTAAFARRADGLYAWGDDLYGQLAADPAAVGLATTPARIAGLPDVADVSAGSVVCVLGTDGSLWCWGVDSAGQVDGTSAGACWTPTRIPDADGW